MPTVVLILLLLGVAFVLYKFDLIKPPSAKAIEFAGTVDKVENDTVFANGYFLENGKPIPGKEDQKVNIEISVDSNTKLTRLAIKIPKGAQVFKIDDLEKEETATNLNIITADSMQNVLGIEAVLKQGSSNTKFVGRALIFRVPVFGNRN